MGGNVSDFADVVSSAQKPIIFDKLRERGSGHQFKEAGTLTDGSILEDVDSFHYPLKASATMQGTSITISLDCGFCPLAIPVQVL